MKQERMFAIRNRCKTPICETGQKPKPGHRGLCDSCYETAMDRVRAGVVTIEELENAGMVDRIYTKKAYFDSAAQRARG